MFVLVAFVLIALAVTAATGWIMGFIGELIPEQLHSTVGYLIAVGAVYLTGYSVLSGFGQPLEPVWADRLVTALALVATVPFIERLVRGIFGNHTLKGA